jgi:hypothetical protein
LFFIEDLRRNAYGLHADKINGHQWWLLQKFLKRTAWLDTEMKRKQRLQNIIEIVKAFHAGRVMMDDFALPRAEQKGGRSDDSTLINGPSTRHISILVWFAPLHLWRGVGGGSGFWFLSHFTSHPKGEKKIITWLNHTLYQVCGGRDENWRKRGSEWQGGKPRFIFPPVQHQYH